MSVIYKHDYQQHLTLTSTLKVVNGTLAKLKNSELAAQILASRVELLTPRLDNSISKQFCMLNKSANFSYIKKGLFFMPFILQNETAHIQRHITNDILLKYPQKCKIQHLRHLSKKIF